MLKKLTFALILTACLVLPFFASARETVYLLEIDGEIKAGTLEYLKRGEKLAEKAGADYLIIKLDTPGGLLNPTKDIVDLLLQSRIPSIVFVNQTGGWAYSAGTFILLAADFAYVHPTALIGACQPQDMFSGEEAGDKATEGMAAWVKSLAENRNRNIQTAEKFVRQNLALTGLEAKEQNIIDGLAENLDELLYQFDLSGAKTVKIEPTLIERFFDFLSHPYLVSLFLVLGTLGLIFAFQSGEIEISGSFGLILLLIGLWGMGIITFNILGIIILALGLFFLLLEVMEPGFGFFGFLGVPIVLLGIFALEGEPLFSPGIFDRVTLFVFGAVLAMTVFFIIVTRSAVKAIRQKPQTGRESMINCLAETINNLNPDGTVTFNKEIWSAKSASGKNIPEKTKVKIIKIEGNTLLVEPLENYV